MAGPNQIESIPGASLESFELTDNKEHRQSLRLSDSSHDLEAASSSESSSSQDMPGTSLDPYEEKDSSSSGYSRDVVCQGSTECMATLLPRPFMSILNTILIPLIPSYFQPVQVSALPPKKLSATAWLDGLRGVASLMVMIHHTIIIWFPDMMKGWGSCSNCYSVLQLPIIRIFYSGTALVAIFFVISGFSLSYRTLMLIQMQNPAETLDSLSSSTFRRSFRLLIPPIVVTFFIMLITYNGFYVTDAKFSTPPRFDTFFGSLDHWFDQTIWMADVLRPVFYRGISYAVYVPIYDNNLWTIDVELYGSFVVFLVVLIVSRLRSFFRRLILLGLPIYLAYYTHAYAFLFISGVTLAELHHIRKSRLSQSEEALAISSAPTPRWLQPSVKSQSRKTFWTTFWLINFFCALWLTTMPLMESGAPESPGYRILAQWIPARYRQPYVQDQFWIYVGAVYLVWTVDNAPFLQSIFTTRIAQYFAKIGFALYLVHGTFLHAGGRIIGPRLQAWVGNGTSRRYTFGVFLTLLCIYPPLFWAADVAWRLLDMKSVAFAKWLYMKVILFKV